MFRDVDRGQALCIFIIAAAGEGRGDRSVKTIMILMQFFKMFVVLAAGII